MSCLATIKVLLVSLAFENRVEEALLLQYANHLLTLLLMYKDVTCLCMILSLKLRGRQRQRRSQRRQDKQQYM